MTLPIKKLPPSGPDTPRKLSRRYRVDCELIAGMRGGSGLWLVYDTLEKCNYAIGIETRDGARALARELNDGGKR
jgi:hypothetical protein